MKRRTLHIIRLVFFDYCAAIISWVIFYSLRKQLLGETVELINLTQLENAFVVGLFWVLLYMFLGFYTGIYKKSRIRELFKLIGASLIGALIIFFVLLLDDEGVANYKAYYKTFSAYFILQFFMTGFFKVAVISYVKRLIRNEKLSFNALIIGSGKNANEIYEEIKNSIDLIGLNFLAYVPIQSDMGALKGKLRPLSNYKNLETIIRRCHVEHVIIALEESEHDQVKELLDMLQGVDVCINIMPDVYQLLMGAVKVNQTFDIPLLEINQDIIPTWQKYLKRFIDIMFSLSVLILGFPILFVIALVTKLTSKGPIFFRQERVGKGGQPFRIIKFRSMYIDSEKNGPALSSDHDARITPWGKMMRKTRMDELPQFLNVLVGEMSVVGPRPERQYFIDLITKEAPYYKHLHRVRPGITSLGQVKFGYAQNVEEMIKRLKYDILYIENMSLAMDFRIILYTILIIFQGRGK